MNDVWSFILFLFATSIAQNIVLTTGFGASMLLRIVRHPKEIAVFSGVLSVFSVLTVTIAYPIDMLIGTSFDAKLLRPLIITGVVAVLYCLAGVILSKCFASFYARISKFLPLAAFNNLVIGVALICNHKLATSLPSAIALALGCCVGFVVLSLLTAEGIERMDNPDIPAAFRGLPIMLVYIGLLALAILGFSPSLSLI